MSSLLPSIAPSRIYGCLLYAQGMFGGLVSFALLEYSDVSMLAAVSIGLNVSLFMWTYALYSGWHDASTPEAKGLEVAADE